MSDAHTVKIDRSAFARGVEEVMTLRPLRDAVSAVLSGNKGPSTSKLVVVKGSKEEGARPDGRHSPTSRSSRSE